MFKGVFRRSSEPFSELILKTTRDLGKYYSRLELASSKLERRNKELFDVCSFYLKKGSEARATVYANEIAEIRKILAVLQHTELAVEQVILRLDTVKTVSPTFEALKGMFSDARTALGLVANVMPSVTPEIEELNTVIGEMLETTQFGLTTSEPLVISNPSTEVILQEAANFVEQELRSRIPEPPAEAEIPRPVKAQRPLIALSADGSEVYVGEDGFIIENDGSSNIPQSSSNLLSEELVMDYIERNNGEMNVTKCAKELNLPTSKVYEVLGSLSRKGKIKIEQ